jgi:O-antigen/teichoic acid export membrane protein
MIWKRKKLTLDLLAYAVGAAAQALMTPVTMLVVTNFLAPREYGQFALFVAAISFSSVVGSQWLQQAITRYVPGEEELTRARELNGAIALGLLIVLNFVGLCCAAIWISYEPLKLEVVAVYRWPFLLGSCGMALWSCILVLKQARFNAVGYNLLKVGTTATLLIFFLLCRSSTKGSLSAIIIAQISAYSWPILVGCRGEGFRDGLRLRKKVLLRKVWTLIKYGLPITVWFLFYTVLNSSDKFFIEHFQGAHYVGIYAANATLALGLVSLIATPVIMTLHPLLMKAWDAGQHGMVNVVINEAINLVLMTGVFIIAMVEMTKEYWLKRLLNEAYVAGGNAIPVLVLAGVLWQVGSYCHKVLEFRQKTGYMAIILGGCVIVSLIFDRLFVPIGGYLAAAWGLVVGNFLYVFSTAALGERFEKKVRIRVNGYRLLVMLGLAAFAILLKDRAALAWFVMLGLAWLYCLWTWERFTVLRAVGTPT